MKRLISATSRQTIAGAATLVLALALLTGINSSSLAAAIGWYDAPACDDVAAQNPGDPNGCLYDAHEGINVGGADGAPACSDGQDNDSDELTDCADPDCLTPGSEGGQSCGGGLWCNVESAEFAGQEGDCGVDDGTNKCGDGQDNDSDGLPDCADPDCAYGVGTWSQICVVIGDPTCPEYTCSAGAIGQDESQCGGSCAPERCHDGQDNDGNGQSDCDDPVCVSRGACQVPAENDYSSCQDGQDNDADGATDCDDPDCAYSQSGTCWWAYSPINPGNWWSTYETDCGNYADDDQDGYYDCADSDCSTDYRCAAVNPTPTVSEASPWGYYDPNTFCTNGSDDDGDGQPDCADYDCHDAAACAARPCSVTETDADGNCEYDNPYWGPSCSDAYDNDQDGRWNCDDPDCASDTACRAGTGPVATVSEIAPDGYPVSWLLGNGYCVDGYDNNQNGWTDCWDDACDGQDPACDSFTGLNTEGWPYDWRYPNGDPRQGGNNHAGGRGGPQVDCGNGLCDSGETFETCSQDCQPIGLGYCGDRSCDSDENAGSCPQDCGDGNPTVTCGDGTCATSEDCTTCQADCGTCGGTGYCGDGSCNNGEDCGGCPGDCGTCLQTYEICSNGADDDGDGAVDCADFDCRDYPDCRPSQPDVCYTASVNSEELANMEPTAPLNSASWNVEPSAASSWFLRQLSGQVQSYGNSQTLRELGAKISLSGCVPWERVFGN